GRYDPDDIERIATSLLAHAGSLVLGCGTVRGAMPLGRRLGNLANGVLMHALMGRQMADTGTGLRGIPAAFALRLLGLEANGYEFELEMLIAAHRRGVPVVEEALGSSDQPSARFNPLVDSLKIYFVLLRFAS